MAKQIVKVYQTKDRDICFMRYNFLKKYNLTDRINKTNYKEVYKMEVTIPEHITIFDYLEELFKLFNYHHPSDYKARSLSTSDIIEIEFDPTKTFVYFCDEYCFKFLGDNRIFK